MQATSQPTYKEIQGHFDLQQRFGQGSYGEVWKAEHKKSGKVVAIKRVFKGAQNLMKHMPEIRAMKSCVSPYIVGYYGCEWLRDDLLIAMELCEFGSLADVMKIRAKAFTEPQVAYILKRTLQAMEHLSSSNKVHRDIKPANIMLCGNGKIKLGDLGITKELRADGTLRDRIGSVLYLAPEIARDLPYNAKVDVWSLGITAVELLLGRAPRSCDRTKEILKQLVTESSGPTLQLPHASPELLQFLQRILQVDPVKRPTAAELLADPFILKATSTSFASLIAELRSVVRVAGGFQAALSLSHNARIEPASLHDDFYIDSDTEDTLSEETYNTGTDPSPASSPDIHHPSPLGLCDKQLITLESEAEIQALIARPILDSPIWIRPQTDFYTQQGFLMGAH